MSDNTKVDAVIEAANGLSPAELTTLANTMLQRMGKGGGLIDRNDLVEAGGKIERGDLAGNIFRNGPPNVLDQTDVSSRTISMVQKSQANIQRSGVNVATGYVGYDLQTPAATLVPFMTPLLNMTPRVEGVGIDTHHWKAIVDFFGGSGPQSFKAGVADGGTPNYLSRSVVPMSNAFQTLSAIDSLTFQAEWRGRALEGDLRAELTAQLLYALKLVEENNLINWSDFLWTPAPILMSAANSGGTITNAVSTTMYFIVTAVNANGETLGTSMQSILIPGTTSSITLTIFTVPNATKYNVYAALASATPATSVMFLQSATTQFGGAAALNQPSSPLIGSFTATMTAPASTGTAHYDTIATAGNTAKVEKDGSGNILSWQGALSQIYANALAGVGTGAGGLHGQVVQPAATTGFLAIADIQNLLITMFNNARANPECIFVGPQDSVSVNNLVASNGETRVVVNSSNGDQANLTAGFKVTKFLNQATQRLMDIVTLPFLAQGTIMIGSLKFPYPVTGYSKAPWRIITNRDYYGVEYPPTLANPMSWGMGDYVDETVVNEFLGGWAVINGIVYH